MEVWFAAINPIGFNTEADKSDSNRSSFPYTICPAGEIPAGFSVLRGSTMSAQIYNIRDYQNPKDIERLYQQQSLEQFAAEVWYASVNPSGIVPTHWPFTDKPEKDPA